MKRGECCLFHINELAVRKPAAEDVTPPFPVAEKRRWKKENSSPFYPSFIPFLPPLCCICLLSGCGQDSYDGLQWWSSWAHACEKKEMAAVCSCPFPSFFPPPLFQHSTSASSFSRISSFFAWKYYSGELVVFKQSQTQRHRNTLCQTVLRSGHRSFVATVINYF